MSKLLNERFKTIRGCERFSEKSWRFPAKRLRFKQSLEVRRTKLKPLILPEDGFAQMSQSLAEMEKQREGLSSDQAKHRGVKSALEAQSAVCPLTLIS